MYGNI